MNRRSFLKFLSAASAATAYSMMPDVSNPHGSAVFAASTATTLPKTLIVIFQRGANDGINTAIPIGDPNYNSTLRPTLYLSPSQVVRLKDLTDTSGTKQDAFFGLHPSLVNIGRYYDQGDAALLPAVHWSQPSRSHFDAQKILELGATNLNSYNPASSSGWVNRYLANKSGAGPLRCIGLEGGLVESLRGSVPISVYPDLTRINGPLSSTEATSLSEQQTQIYGQAATTAVEQETYTMGKTFVKDLATLRGIDFKNYAPANGATYPSNTFGTQLKQLAALIKNETMLELATLSLGGWDSHAEQAVMQAGSLTTLDQGIHALWTDLGSTYMQNVLVLVMTEFGRTAAETLSKGTDHGKAACWMVLGPAAKGRFYGRAPSGWTGNPNTAPYYGYPGLSSNQLDEGRFLKFNIDYRDVLAELMTKHLGVSSSLMGTLLPGHTYKSIGFL